MVKFFLFIKKIHFVLLFIILEILAIRYYAISTTYSRAKLVAASNVLMGGIYAKVSGIGSYFSLKKENESLNKELAFLRNQLDSHYADYTDKTGMSDTTVKDRRYVYKTARVVGSTTARQNNYITLNKGRSDGLEPDMAVMSGGSILGYVLDCSEHFAVCISLLNRDFRTSGKIQNTDFYGSVYWDGVSPYHVTLSEVSKYAVVNVGDTVLTTDYSSIFPPDVMIGTVESAELVNNDTYYDIKVKLAANLFSPNNVQVVKFIRGDEQRDIESRYGRNQ